MEILPVKRFQVYIDGHHEGFIEALDNAAASKAAYQQYPALRDQRRWLQLQRDDRMTHILIDTTGYRAIARHDSRKALAALAVIQFANVDTQIIRLGENKHWAAFNSEQLGKIATSVGITIPKGSKYPEFIKAVRQAMETIEILALPFTTEQLVGQAYAMSPSEARPHGFDPNGHEPKLLKEWPFPPQQPRKRADSTFWYEFAAGLGHGAGTTTPETLAHLEGRVAPAPPVAQQGKPPKPPKAPAAPKPPRAPSGPATRPKAGTTTGKVWDVADAALTAAGGAENIDDWKAFRASVTKLCEAEGINAGTVGVQFGKWKSSKGI